MQAVHLKTQCIYCNVWRDTKQCIYCCTQMDSNSRFCLCTCWRWWCISEQELHGSFLLGQQHQEKVPIISHTESQCFTCCTPPICFPFRQYSIWYQSHTLMLFWAHFCDKMFVSACGSVMPDSKIMLWQMIKCLQDLWQLHSNTTLNLFSKIDGWSTLTRSFTLNLMRGFPAAHHRKGVVPFLKKIK